uniref:choice-of-anchor R domain-containing protein n=1 Tax=Acidovorax sp. DW039 TaxID=3095606 RepID=UPI00403F931C
MHVFRRFFFCLLLLSVGLAYGQISIFNSLQAGSPEPGYCAATPFKMAVVLDVPSGKNYRLSEITWSLSYETTDPTADFQLAIYADGGTGPGSIVGTYWNQQTPWSSFPSVNDVLVSGGDVVFKPVNPVTLQAGQRYWVVGGFTDIARCAGYARQGGSTSASGPLVLSSYSQFYAAIGNPSWQQTSTPTSIKLVALAVSVVDDGYAVSVDAPTPLNVTSNDDIGATLDTSFPLTLSNPVAGTLNYSGNQVLFTPSAASFTAPVTFTYRACKVGNDCGTATVTLTPSRATPVPTLETTGLLLTALFVGVGGALTSRRDRRFGSR